MKAIISVIVPVLDEAADLGATLARLQPLRSRGHEVRVVDGGSRDATVAVAEPLSDVVLTAPRGRARQMNAGAEDARGDVLWFLHGDTLPPEDADGLILTALADPRRHWGRFDARLSGSLPMLRVVETMMNLRSRVTGVATGDQGIFVRRHTFQELGGYPSIPLMEDLALSDALLGRCRPVCLAQRVTTSSRRWERDGVWPTIFLMWRLRWAYRRGVDPVLLARRYYGFEAVD
ncbi:MAG: TIGR04283 family arsenosugar biosynthesis glycosyltransferase [Candidatus Competibacterales bacterium]